MVLLDQIMTVVFEALIFIRLLLYHFVKYCIGIFMYAYIYCVMIDLCFILCMPILVLL